MDYAYGLMPVLAWLVAGSLKFAVNSARTGRAAFGLVGYGGFPSTHSAIVSSTAAFIGLREGFDHPAFGIAVTLAFIVMLDAASLRRQIGKHAEAINLAPGRKGPVLRERMGHTPVEIGAGIAVGVVLAAVATAVLGA